MDDICVFCLRPVPTRGHHLVPRCKGGREIVPACQSCEDFIHKTWTHNELRDVFDTVEKIRADDRFQKFLKWLERLKKNCGRSAVGNFGVLARLSEGACLKWPATERKRSQNPKEPLPPNGQNFFENALNKQKTETIFKTRRNRMRTARKYK